MKFQICLARDLDQEINRLRWSNSSAVILVDDLTHILIEAGKNKLH
jgi:hypothetical protein